MFGHIEEPWELARHMRVVRELQERTGGITEFVPLSFIPFQTLLGRTHGIEEISRDENLKHTAAFRLALGRTIKNLQASWVKMGLDAATESLRWGVNDLGGTLMEENISRMAGSQHGVRLEPEDLIAAARPRAAPRPNAPPSTRSSRRTEPRRAARGRPQSSAGLGTVSVPESLTRRADRRDRGACRRGSTAWWRGGSSCARRDRAGRSSVASAAAASTSSTAASTSSVTTVPPAPRTARQPPCLACGPQRGPEPSNRRGPLGAAPLPSHGARLRHGPAQAGATRPNLEHPPRRPRPSRRPPPRRPAPSPARRARSSTSAGDARRRRPRAASSPRPTTGAWRASASCRDQLERNPGKRGTRRLRRVLDLPGGPQRTRSPAERALLRLLRGQRHHRLRLQRANLRLRGRRALARRGASRWRSTATTRTPAAPRSSATG